MDWINYRRLVNYIIALNPREFNYATTCMCVGGHVKVLDATASDFGTSAIRDFLSVTPKEADYIFGVSAAWDGVGLSCYRTYESHKTTFTDTAGEAGIREALRRLAVVAARHGGEPSQPQPAYQPDDQQFLASVRSLIGSPLVEVE